jgi:hypothetical protein
MRNEIMDMLKTVLEQTYIHVNEQYYPQKEGLAMGAPTSAILSEVCIQHLEHTIIAYILMKHEIIDYYRYVDNVLVKYDQQKTNINICSNLMQ